MPPNTVSEPLVVSALPIGLSFDQSENQQTNGASTPWQKANVNLAPTSIGFSATGR